MSVANCTHYVVTMSRCCRVSFVDATLVWAFMSCRLVPKWIMIACSGWHLLNNDRVDVLNFLFFLDFVPVSVIITLFCASSLTLPAVGFLFSLLVCFVFFNIVYLPCKQSDFFKHKIETIYWITSAITTLVLSTDFTSHFYFVTFYFTLG